MDVRVIVDPDTCIGSGECVATDPEVIALNADGVAQLLVAELEESRATSLCDVCPVGALSIG